MKDFDHIKDDVIEKIQKNAPDLSCGVCAEQEFTLVGYVMLPVQDKNLDKRMLGGSSTVPVAGLVCKNCGFLHQFALGALDLLDEDAQYGE